MKLRFLALMLSLLALSGITVTASETSEQQTDPPASLPSTMQPPGEDENAHIKTTPDGIRYSIKQDGTVRIEGCRTTAVKLQLPSSIDGKTVNEIAPAAFQKESGLIGIVIPDSITLIGERAFESCENLTSVILPDTLPLIPYRCFAECDSLRDVTLPTALEEIGERAFVGCTLLGRLEIPEDQPDEAGIGNGVHGFHGTGIHIKPGLSHQNLSGKGHILTVIPTVQHPVSIPVGICLT